MPTIEDNKKRFLDIYNEFIINSRTGADELLNWLEASDFFTAPASTKYHSNYEGGLLQHSLNVYDILLKRCKEDKELEISDTSIAIAALMHDVCKVNFYKKGKRNVKVNGSWVEKEIFEIEEKFPCGDHSDKSIIILQNFIHLNQDEILAIRAHMGAFDAAAKGGSYFINKIFERSRFAVHLNLADIESTYLMEETIS